MDILRHGKNILREKMKDSSNRYNLVAIATDKRGKIISIGFNSYTKTHPIQKDYSERARIENKEFLHAEISAIIKARGKKIHKLTIIRMNQSDETCSAAPCHICQLAIKEAGIELIEHTT